MAPETTLGKRKRRIPPAARNEEDDTAKLHAQEVFRRHFEAHFQPIPEAKKVVGDIKKVSDDESEESEWGGISEDGDDVQVVEHTDEYARIAAMPKEQLKAYMSYKPPIASENISVIRDKASKVEDDDASESANLKKDLELQRLLSESHLLDSANNHTLQGTNRHKATDLRLQALGAKGSLWRQEKMPMAHRKGIVAKAEEKDVKRRKEARENGIILEKATGVKSLHSKPTKIVKKGRERGVDAPGIGRFSGGTLKLSRKDIFDIEGPRKGLGGKSRRSGSKGGSRGKR
ncbi:hypothetical protein B0O99DRAFT_680118 [Bisporella sp. PMI_857]|nr:hypothetical protein B0O99DRAFT_680118 [Bisporella sp. PMI_857]